MLLAIVLVFGFLGGVAVGLWWGVVFVLFAFVLIERCWLGLGV